MIYLFKRSSIDIFNASIKLVPTQQQSAHWQQPILYPQPSACPKPATILAFAEPAPDILLQPIPVSTVLPGARPVLLPAEQPRQQQLRASKFLTKQPTPELCSKQLTSKLWAKQLGPEQLFSKHQWPVQPFAQQPRPEQLPAK